MAFTLIVIFALTLVIVNVVNINQNGYKTINRVRMISLISGLILYWLLYSVSHFIKFDGYDKRLEDFKTVFYLDVFFIIALVFIVILIEKRVPKEISWALIILIATANLYVIAFACMLPVALFGWATAFLYLFHFDVLVVSISMVLKLRRNILRIGEFSVC